MTSASSQGNTSKKRMEWNIKVYREKNSTHVEIYPENLPFGTEETE